MDGWFPTFSTLRFPSSPCKAHWHRLPCTTCTFCAVLCWSFYGLSCHHEQVSEAANTCAQNNKTPYTIWRFVVLITCTNEYTCVTYVYIHACLNCLSQSSLITKNQVVSKHKACTQTINKLQWQTRACAGRSPSRPVRTKKNFRVAISTPFS